MNWGTYKFLILAAYRVIRRHPIRFFLQCLSVALAISLVISVRVSSRESIKVFDSLTGIATKSWTYELRHINGELPDELLQYIAVSSISEFILARESVVSIPNTENQTVRILDIIGGTAKVGDLILDTAHDCLVREDYPHKEFLTITEIGCNNPNFVKGLPYDVLRKSIDKNFKPSFMAIFDSVLPEEITAFTSAFPGLLAESRYDKLARASSLTYAYRSNLEFLLILAVFLTAFVVFSCALHGYGTMKVLLITFRTLGVSRSAGLLFASCEGIIVGLVGSVIGVTLLSPLTKFLAQAYFLSTQAHHQASSALPTFQQNWSDDLLTALVVGVGASIAGSLLPALKLMFTPPSIAPREDESTFISANLLNTISVIVVAFSILLFLIAANVQILWVSYASALSLFLCGGALSFLLLSVCSGIAAIVFGHRSAPILFTTRTVSHEPVRFGLSAFAFGCGFAFLISLHLFIGGFRETLISWMDTTFAGDIYLRNDAGSIPTRVADILANTNNISWLTENREIDIPFQNSRIKMYLVPLKIALHEHLYDIQEISADPGFLVSEVAARKYGLKIGRSVQILNTSFTVGGIYRDFANERGAFLLDFEKYRGIFPEVPVKAVTVKMKEGFAASGNVLRTRLEALKIPALRVFNPQTLKDEALRIFDNTFRITTYIQILVFGVCIINFALTFLQDIESRIRQYGTLRLLGFSSRDFLTTIVTLALVIVSASAGGGIVFGTLLGSAILGQINPLSFGWTIKNTASITVVFVPIIFGLLSCLVVLPLLFYPVKRRIEAAKVTLE